MIQFKDEIEREFWCSVFEMIADEYAPGPAAAYADAAVEHRRQRSEEMAARRAAEDAEFQAGLGRAWTGGR